MNIKTILKKLIVKKPLKLDCGKTIKDFPIAYETYGSLNSQKDNAILVFHALTGDQYVSGTNPVTKKDGWWSYAVGPDKAIDTKIYFVICFVIIEFLPCSLINFVILLVSKWSLILLSK